MTVTELIIALEAIPSECKNYHVIIREIIEIEEYVAYVDKPVVGFWCDSEHDELCLMDNENIGKFEYMNADGYEA